MIANYAKLWRCIKKFPQNLMNRCSVFAEVFLDGAVGQNIKLSVVAASYFKVCQGQAVFGNSEVCLDYVLSCRYGRSFALIPTFGGIKSLGVSELLHCQDTTNLDARTEAYLTTSSSMSYDRLLPCVNYSYLSDLQ